MGKIDRILLRIPYIGLLYIISMMGSHDAELQNIDPDELKTPCRIQLVTIVLSVVLLKLFY